jgi:hypothetical protein
MLTGRISGMRLGFCSVYQTPANSRRLAEFAAGARPPAQFDRSQFVFSVGGQFRNTASSESSWRNLSRRFAKSVLLLTSTRCE